jgi:hypothetical protein
MNLLSLDSRWRRFNDENRACPCCGRQFNGIFDIGFDQPDDWAHAPRTGDADVIVAEDRLGVDLCRVGGQNFIRAVLNIPLRGSDESFGFGCWVEVPQPIFLAYLATYETPPATFDPAEGLLANTLPDFDQALGSAVRVDLTDTQHRPQLTAAEGMLADEQTNGISFDRLLDIYAAVDMDIRPHLAAD